jgi:integrase
MATDHLWQRGRQYYLRVAIPRPHRPLFLSKTGKPMSKIVEPLGDSYQDAKVMAAERAAKCMRVFAQVKAGLLKTPKEVADAMRPPEEFDIALQPGFDAAMRRYLASPELRRAEFERRGRAMWEQHARRFEAYGDRAGDTVSGEQPAAQPTPAAPRGETITEAMEAWFKELERHRPRRAATRDGHRLRVRAFTEKFGDVALADVTRSMASDFLQLDGRSNRTRNNYSRTLKAIFKCAARRGRFSGKNPFDEQRFEVDEEGSVRFTTAELQTLFDGMPREVEPKKHTPDTALPWAALVALYSGMRLQEVAGLSVADVRQAEANGGKVTVFDLHDRRRKLKNKSAVRLIPVHPELVRLGLLDYVAALPKGGSLFPGILQPKSKTGRFGHRVGQLFHAKRVALGVTREGLTFHSLRHNVASALDAAEVRQSDASRILGHKVKGMPFGTYSKEGPGLKVVAAVVEKVVYEGLRL